MELRTATMMRPVMVIIPDSRNPVNAVSYNFRVRVRVRVGVLG